MRCGRSDWLKFCVGKIMPSNWGLKEKTWPDESGRENNSTRVTDLPMTTNLPFLIQHLTYIPFCFLVFVHRVYLAWYIRQKTYGHWLTVVAFNFLKNTFNSLKKRGEPWVSQNGQMWMVATVSCFNSLNILSSLMVKSISSTSLHGLYHIVRM